MYLGSKAGRAPKKAKNDHRHHASLNIVAHKSSDYVCNSNFDGRKLRSLAPKVGARMPELDDVGVVVSVNHPPKSTSLGACSRRILCSEVSFVYAFVNMNCRIIPRAMVSAFGFIVGKKKTSFYSSSSVASCGVARYRIN